MKHITFSDPFTGLEFEAVLFDDGTLTARNPLTKKVFVFKHDEKTNTLNIPVDQFESKPLVTLNDAADMLDISKQRVCALANASVLDSIKIGNTLLISRESVAWYDDHRKPGRPKKD